MPPMQISGGRRMPNSRDSGSSINIGMLSGSLIYAGNDISGSPRVDIYHSRPSNDQVLSSLEVVLELRDIPWSNPDLAEVRRVFEEAIKQQNPQGSSLERAIKKLKTICEQIAIGVLSNGAFQVLMQHIK
jgi:hypothetical protein